MSAADVDRVAVGTVLLGAFSCGLPRERFVVIDETRTSWIVCRERSLPNPPEHMRDRVAKDTMQPRGVSRDRIAPKWFTEARVACDALCGVLVKSITTALPALELEKLRAVADLLGLKVDA